MKREIVDEADINAFAQESCDAGYATESSFRSREGYGTTLPRICSNGRQLRDISTEALRALQDCNNPPLSLPAAD